MDGNLLADRFFPVRDIANDHVLSMLLITFYVLFLCLYLFEGPQPIMLNGIHENINF
jgi:hypothetical protein